MMLFIYIKKNYSSSSREREDKLSCIQRNLRKLDNIILPVKTLNSRYARTHTGRAAFV